MVNERCCFLQIIEDVECRCLTGFMEFMATHEQTLF
jgi:hypothetical protein